ncbi:MAG: tetratricopeptide repeat protein [Acidobacteriota bacterium]|nr:tetratricopeptide repeat protein [Acidobacteriota bacterium]
MSSCPTTFSEVWRFSVLWLLALALAACGGDPMEELGLEPVPEPAVERMEPAVREQLKERRQAVDELLEQNESEPARLARTYGELGAAYHTYEHLEAAAAAFRNARQLAPAEPRWAYFLGLVYKAQGRTEAAAEQLQTVLTRRQDYLPAWIQLGEAQLQAGDAQAAAESFRQAVELNADSAAARYGLGRAELARDDAAAAVEQLEAALKLEPAATAVHYPLGQAYRKLGDGEKAAEHLGARGPTTTTLPDPWLAEARSEAAGAGVHLQRGGQATVAGDLEAAAESYRRAVEADPGNAAARQSLGAALARLGDGEGAREQLLRAQELDPDNPVLHYNLGLVYQGMGDLDGALQELRRAVELDGSQDDFRRALAELHERRGELEQALEQYEALLARSPQDLLSRHRRAELWAAAGRGDEAVEDLRRAVEQAPESLEARLSLAAILARAGRLDEARRAVEEALPRAQDDAGRARVYALEAQVERGRGRDAAAVEAYRRALELNPQLNATRLALAAFQGERGEYGEAAELFAEVRRQNPSETMAWLGEVTALTLGDRRAQARRTLEEAISALPNNVHLAHALARLLATSGEVSGEDARRALALAQAAMEESQTLERGETLALALAAAGRYDEALALQEQLLAAARRESLTDLADRLEADAERYRQGRRSVLVEGSP